MIIIHKPTQHKQSNNNITYYLLLSKLRFYSTDYSKKPKSTSMPEPATNGQDATKQSIEKKDNKAIADSISKDVKKAKG